MVTRAASPDSHARDFLTHHSLAVRLLREHRLPRRVPHIHGCVVHDTFRLTYRICLVRQASYDMWLSVSVSVGERYRT